MHIAMNPSLHLKPHARPNAAAIGRFNERHLATAGAALVLLLLLAFYLVLLSAVTDAPLRRERARLAAERALAHCEAVTAPRAAGDPCLDLSGDDSAAARR